MDLVNQLLISFYWRLLAEILRLCSSWLAFLFGCSMINFEVQISRVSLFEKKHHVSEVDLPIWLEIRIKREQDIKLFAIVHKASAGK